MKKHSRMPFLFVAMAAVVIFWSLPTLGKQLTSHQGPITLTEKKQQPEPTSTPSVILRPVRAWEKIVFEKGAISWSARISPKIQGYFFFAFAGQSAEILVIKSDGRLANVTLALSGADGSVYQAHNLGRADWRGLLPKTQNYYITIAAPHKATGTELRVTIYPPMRKHMEEFNSQLGFVVSYDTTIWRKSLPGYFDNEVFGLLLTDNRLYENTNLQEVYFVISREDLLEKGACLEAKPQAGETEERGIWRVNKIDYRYYHTEEGAAGNLYRTELFRTFVHNRCIIVRLFTHETNIGNYFSTQVKSYRRKKVIDELKQIFYTLRWP